MTLVESGLAEAGFRRAFSGNWIRNRGRSDAELDERDGVRLARELRLELPTTRGGRALAGQMGMLHRLGMSKRDLRAYAEERIREIKPKKRPQASVYDKPVDTAAQTPPKRSRKRKRIATVERTESLRDMPRRMTGKFSRRA
jgi:hypothetical protein